MACLNGYTLKGIGFDCNPNLAGIKKIYLGYHEDFTVTVTETSEDNATTHSASIEAIGDGKLYEYTFAKRTGSLTSTLTKDETKGTRYYTNEITLQFNKLEGWKHMEIEAMAAEALIAVVIDNNNNGWLVGADGYLSATASTAQTGDSYDSMNGYNITMSAMSAHLPYTINESDLTGLVG